VDAAEESFHSVIRASVSRGLTLDRAFAHFDVLGVGAVTPDQFMEGLKVCGPWGGDWEGVVSPPSPSWTTVVSKCHGPCRWRVWVTNWTSGACVHVCLRPCVHPVPFGQLLGIHMHELAMRILVARVPLDRGGLIGLPQFDIFCEPATRGTGEGSGKPLSLDDTSGSSCVCTWVGEAVPGPRVLAIPECMCVCVCVCSAFCAKQGLYQCQVAVGRVVPSPT
jgi:hypothetical protein